MAKPNSGAWTAPKNDPRNVGAFVQQNYGKNAKIAQRVYRQLMSKGAEFYRADDKDPWTRVTDAMRRRGPEGWGTGDGIIGGWTDATKPNLDTSVYEFGKNKVGRWFARKPTLEQQLTPMERSYLTAFDAKAEAAPIPVNKAYDDAYAAAQNTATQYQNNTTAAEQMIGNTVSAQEQASGVANANRSANDAAMAQARAAASNLAQKNYYAAAPQNVRTQQANALATLTAKTAESRVSLLQKLAASVAEREMAKAKNANDLRAAQMRYLGTLAQIQGNKDIAAANNAADLQQTQIGAGATVDAATIRAGATGGAADARDAAAQAKAFKQWSGKLAGRMKGRQRDYTVWVLPGGVTLWDDPSDNTDQKVPVTAKTPGASQATKTDTIGGSQTGWARIVSEGVSEGYNPKQVLLAVIRANPSLRQLDTRRMWNSIVAAFVSDGMALAQARKTASAMTGYKMKG